MYGFITLATRQTLAASHRSALVALHRLRHPRRASSGFDVALDDHSVDEYTMLISSILYFQRKITGSAFTSAK
jgi:hypothetical protein